MFICKQCGIPTIPTDIIQEMTALHHLYMASNDITSWPDFGKVTKTLTNLDLSSNPFTTDPVIPDGAIDNMTRLVSLNLGNVGLKEFPMLGLLIYRWNALESTAV
jgi:Leucine-rich repeat (LRR) protein